MNGMPLSYSTDCEEISYSKDSSALKAIADEALTTYDLEPNAYYQTIWEFAEKYYGHDVTWINWHGDEYATALFYVGTEAEVMARLRKLDECSMS